MCGLALESGKDVASEESTRMQLFGDDGKPRQRTAEEIKAAYGHPSKAVVRFSTL